MTGQYLRYGTVINKFTTADGLVMAVVRQHGYKVTAWIPWEETNENRVVSGQKYTLTKIGATYALGQRLTQAN